MECKNNSNIINDNFSCNPKYSCKDDNEEITHDNKFSTNDQTKKKNEIVVLAEKLSKILKIGYCNLNGRINKLKDEIQNIVQKENFDMHWD